jgi:hypothetical protein
VLIFYRRMFFIYRRFLIVNTVMMAIVACWAISFFFGTLFQCKDPRTLWTTFENAREGCINTIEFYYAVSISGFVTDLMILLSPLPIIYRMNLPRRSRIAVAGVLLLGAVYVLTLSTRMILANCVCRVCGAGIGRFVTFIYVGRHIETNISDLTCRCFSSSVRYI